LINNDVTAQKGFARFFSRRRRLDTRIWLDTTMVRYTNDSVHIRLDFLEDLKF
jgi:hypothetical protein